MGLYCRRLPQEFTTGVYCVRLPWEFTVGGYHRSLPWEVLFQFTMKVYHGRFEAYFEVLHPLWIVDNLRTLKIHHYFS